MKKTVVALDEADLPAPFCLYWHDIPNRLDRDYEFYLVDGELYILDIRNEGDHPLLRHWTQVGCAGIALFMMDNGIPVNRAAPYIHRDGTYLFEVVPSDDYETSVVHPETGELFCVHSG